MRAAIAMVGDAPGPGAELLSLPYDAPPFEALSAVHSLPYARAKKWG